MNSKMNQKEELPLADKLFILMAWKVNGMSQGSAYESWSDHFARKKCAEYWKDNTHQLGEWRFTISDLKTLSEEDLKKLGFRDWDGNKHFLLPLWLVPNMKHESGYYSLWNNPVALTKDTDLDHRGGCIALWFPWDDSKPLPKAEHEPSLSELLEGVEVVELVNGEVHPFRDDEHQ